MILAGGFLCHLRMPELGRVCVSAKKFATLPTRDDWLKGGGGLLAEV